MKARFLALAALVLGLASCQKDFDAANPVGGGEVDFQLSVGAAELATRASEDQVNDGVSGLNSAYGAIDYLQAEDNGDATLRVDWNDVNLRYTLEVYDKAASYADDVEPVKDRQVKIVDEYAPVVFDLRLVPGREYHFVVFADFVPQSVTDATQTASIADQRTLGKHHEIGNTLADIKVVSDGINDECTDAYFATKDIVIENSAAQDIVLKRPYGKLRVIATDLAELNINVDPTCVVVTYDETHPTEFNAITGETKAVTSTATVTFDSEYNDGVGKASLANHFYTADFDAKKAPNAENVERHTHMTLFTDYILADKVDQTPYHFTMKVYEDDSKADDKLIKETKFSTDIPVERNKLTTVIGNVLTTATEIEVRIDDNFANGSTWNPEEDDFDMQAWDGSVKEPKLDANGNYIIEEANELAWLAAAVNGTLSRASVEPQNFAGKTFKLTQDIDLNGERWTPIGLNADSANKFKGTFDGNGKTIYNLLVSTRDGYTAAGLFGAVQGTVKNFTIENATVEHVITSSNGNSSNGIAVVAGSIYTSGSIEDVTVKNAVVRGNRYVGGIAGFVYGNVKNCTVEGIDIVVTPNEYNGGYDNGDKAGAIVGYFCDESKFELSGNKVADFTIQAYRDLGGVVGCANNAAYVKSNSAKNGKLIVDQKTNSYGEKNVNAGYIVGRCVNGTLDESNTSDGVVVEKFIGGEKALAAATALAQDNVVVELSKDVTLKGGTEANFAKAKTITIDGKGNKLTYSDSYRTYVKMAEGGKIIYKDLKLYRETTGTNTHWHNNNMKFVCDAEFQNVEFNKGICFDGAKTFVLNNSTITKNKVATYALFITAGCDVTIDGLTVNHAEGVAGRGIKIVDEDVADKTASTKLSVANSKFTTADKAAILVGSKGGANIALKNLDIENVAADKVNAVWVDSDYKAYANKVTVTGGSMIVEGLKPIEGDENTDVQTALNNAVKEENAVIQVAAGEYTFPTGFAKGVTVICEEGTVFNGSSSLNINGATVVGATFENQSGSVGYYTTVNGTYKNCVFDGSNALRMCNAGETVVFENCVFTGNVYGVHFDSGSNDAIFRNCTLSGFNTFGAALTELTLEDCTFVANGRSGYNGINMWGNTNLIRCEFTFDGSVTEWVDVVNSNKSFKIEDCTVNGQPFVISDLGIYGDCDVRLDGEHYGFASSNEGLKYTLEKGASIIDLYKDGEYSMPSVAKNKTFTINGNGENTIIKVAQPAGGETLDGNIDYSTVTFNKVRIVTGNTGAGYNNGFTRPASVTYNECIIDGMYSTINNHHTFNKCTFNQTGDRYNVWTWGAKTATFTECTFNCDGKAMLLYGYGPTVLTMTDCVFNDNGGLADELKAAIEIGNDFGATYELIVNNATVNGFAINPKGTPTNTTLWANKNSMTQDKLNVVVDGVDVF